MGFKSKRARDEDTVYVTVPVPGWLKNQLVDLSVLRELSFQRLVNFLLINGVRDAEGLALLEVSEPVKPTCPCAARVHKVLPFKASMQVTAV